MQPTTVGCVWSYQTKTRERTMKLPEGPITGTVWALAQSREELAKSLGSKYDPVKLYDDESDAQDDSYYDDDRRVFEIQITIP
jgi:predicted secreted protein